MTNAYADSIKIGILVGFTGPIESLTPAIAQGAELAMQEASESGNLLGGRTVESVRGDSTCTDAAAATAAAERLITSDKVAAIMGADCSGVTMAVANNVGIPNGIVMISPSATSPALSTLDDNGYFFRVAPSDARQGQVLADILKRRGVTNVAITYTNNDYGKGLADSFGAAFKAIGGTIGMTAAHEDGKADILRKLERCQLPERNIWLFSVMWTRAVKESCRLHWTPEHSAVSLVPMVWQVCR